MIALFQTPIPLPPAADPNLLTERTIEGVVIVLIIVAISVIAISVLKPLIQAWARRIEGRGTDPALRAEVDSLHERVAEVEPLQRRVLELEERLEFAERLLAQRRDPEAIGRGGAG